MPNTVLSLGDTKITTKKRRRRRRKRKGIPDSPSRTTSISRVYLYVDGTITRMLRGREPPQILP